MKNLAKLSIEQKKAAGKMKPMMSARTARAVPQMRKAMKHMTGIKHGGDIKVIRPRPTYKGKILKLIQIYDPIPKNLKWFCSLLLPALLYESYNTERLP